ncbi:MAG: hypothetical protein P4L99_08805 [Chthoniobacter sp.]|nr:hypothetical protein [Chthoniobacter sp.]
MNDAEEFLRSYGSTEFTHSERLLPLLREGGVKVEHSDGLPCSHYEEIYRVRARLNARSDRPHAADLSAQCNALADELAKSPAEPCRLWLFREPGNIFCVFEMVRSRRIVGSFRFHNGRTA